MSRNDDGTAFDAASREAWKIRESVIEAIREAIASGEVTEDSADESLFERLHSEIDNALTYASDQWVCAYGMRQERDPFAEGLLESPQSIEQVIAAQAYLNLVDSIDVSIFSDDFRVAEDKRAETEGA